MEPPAARVALASPERKCPTRGTVTRDYLILLGIVVVSRVATTIYYIEDTDSLRFALSVSDYSVAELRPHFPGYPVFAFLAKSLTTLTGSYAIAFSLIGALGTWSIIYYLQRLLRVSPTEPLGLLLAVLVFFNPMVWLLSNRYMPDLLGAACGLAAVYHLMQGRRNTGFFLAGLLAGIRLSHLPFVLPSVLLALRTRTLQGIAFGSAGVLVWCIPLVLDTGWAELSAAARRQTDGHFGEFGGTLYTEPDFGERAVGVLKGVWAHGLGAYWPLRHPITLVTAAGFASALALGVRPLIRALTPRVLYIFAGSWGTYLLWIFFFQNVIHKSRHVLPLLPFLLLLAAVGAWELSRRTSIGRAFLTLFLAGYASVGVVLAAQHRHPTAIAQVAEQLRSKGAGELHVLSIPLANFYLSSVGVDARFFSVEDPTALPHLSAGDRLVAVGAEPAWADRPSSVRSFYHNPFVNPMWSEIVVREYVSVGN